MTDLTDVPAARKGIALYIPHCIRELYRAFPVHVEYSSVGSVSKSSLMKTKGEFHVRTN